MRNIGREGQTARVLTLAELENTAVDMFTTVYIGNAATRALGGKMVTRGGTADEGGRFQRHDRGAGSFSRQLAALGAEYGQCGHPAGAEEQGETAGITVHCGRLDADAMAALLQGAALCVDATHPYAVEATSNIRVAVRRGCGISPPAARASPCLPAVWCLQTAAQAAAYLAGQTGQYPAGNRC